MLPLPVLAASATVQPRETVHSIYTPTEHVHLAENQEWESEAEDPILPTNPQGGSMRPLPALSQA